MPIAVQPLRALREASPKLWFAKRHRVHYGVRMSAGQKKKTTTTI